MSRKAMTTPSFTHILSSSPNLPVDVLCEIFKFYIEEEHSYRPPALMRSPKDIPWFLGHVCRLWRMAAITTPQLWDRFPPLKITAQNEPLDSDLMIDELLKRSRTPPIHAQFDCARYSPETGNHIKSNPVLMSLLAASKKWEKMTIRCPDLRSLKYYFREIEGCIPSLRRVELLFPLGLTGGRSLEEHLTIFHDTPNLSELLLHDLPVTFWGSLPDIPWEQLTRLQYCGGGQGRFYEVLKRAVNLDTFMVAVFSFCNEARPLLEHSKLRQLQFYVEKTDYLFPDSLHQLKAPALEILVVTFEPTSSFSFVVTPALVFLLVRSRCKLKHLVLSLPLLRDAEVSDLLAATLDLETLELGNCAKLDEGLLSLVLKEPEAFSLPEAFLPNLHALTLVFPTTMDPHHVTIIRRIVESRSQVPSLALCTPLRSVRLTIRHPSARFQACLNLNNGSIDPSDIPNAENCETLLNDFLRIIEAPSSGSILECEHRAADAMRLAHVFHKSDPIRSKLPTLRKICQQLVTDDFIKTCEWMLAGEEDIVYIHPEHELRNSPNRWDIVFGLFDAGPESLEGYRATEFSVEQREWWNL